jgi:branched-chain amino acid aminotransferase
MPEVPLEVFMRAIDDLLVADSPCLPDDSNLSLYLRPVLWATEPCLALRPAREYSFMVIAFVTGGFFADSPESIAIWVSHDYSRAVPGGTGDIKCAGNYAPAYLAQRQAEAAGCRQVLWLDPIERRWVEELGAMNFFVVRGSQLITPQQTGTLLPGVTRDSLLTLAASLGYEPVEAGISLDQLRVECKRGIITEAFACGTAALVTPIGSVRDGDSGWAIGDGHAGPATLALRRALVEIHHGSAADPRGWLHRPTRAGAPGQGVPPPESQPTTLRPPRPNGR